MTTLLRPLAPFARAETYRALLFHIGGVALGAVGLAVVITGWCLTACLAITPLVVPILIGFRMAVGLLARAAAGLAQLLGVRIDPPVATVGTGFWGRGLAVLGDLAFWRQQAYVLAAWPMALLQTSLLALAIQVMAIPIYYRSSEEDLFGAHVDTLPEALLFVPAGVALLVLVVHLTGPLARLSRHLAARLLPAEVAPVWSPAELKARRFRHLMIHVVGSSAVGSVLFVIWALTTGGYFWPVWALLPLGLVLGIHAWVVLVLERPGIRQLTGGSATLAAHAGISVLLFDFLVAIWAITTRGYFWPIWPLIGLAVPVVMHTAVILYRRVHRIETLETSRAGAVDAQEAELRRIERDLHDGAQARLVALGMSLGLAEQKLETDPEAVRELLAEARRGAGEALEELRDLARGIHPPILSDRGLEAAIAALTARSPWPVTVSVDVPKRPVSAVETAAYFVVAEALANVAKHAQASRVDIRIRSADGTLLAEVVDDGQGGATASGRGLTGLRQRVEALDGTLGVTSPVGGPTSVRAELPCGS